MLSRLVGLNQSRAAAEARGDIHWLRPDYQKARLAGKFSEMSELDLGETVAAIPETAKPKWPADDLDQIKLVRGVLAQADAPLGPDAVNAHFKGGRNRRARVDQVLASMAETGMIRAGEEGGHFLPR